MWLRERERERDCDDHWLLLSHLDKGLSYTYASVTLTPACVVIRSMAFASSVYSVIVILKNYCRICEQLLNDGPLSEEWLQKSLLEIK